MLKLFVMFNQFENINVKIFQAGCVLNQKRLTIISSNSVLYNTYNRRVYIWSKSSDKTENIFVVLF